MKIKSVTIYRPDGKGYLEVGRSLLDEKGEEMNIQVKSMSVIFGKIIVVFSNGDRVVYGKFPYIATKL